MECRSLGLTQLKILCGLQDMKSASEVKGAFLVDAPDVPLYEPRTQAPPASTEDMLTEQEVALSALGTLPVRVLDEKAFPSASVSP